MKKSKIWIVVLIGLMMAVGFAMTGCDKSDNCPGGCGHSEAADCSSDCTFSNPCGC
jgi:hypothetical protein